MLLACRFDGRYSLPALFSVQWNEGVEASHDDPDFACCIDKLSGEYSFLQRLEIQLPVRFGDDGFSPL